MRIVAVDKDTGEDGVAFMYRLSSLVGQGRVFDIETRDDGADRGKRLSVSYVAGVVSLSHETPVMVHANPPTLEWGGPPVHYTVDELRIVVAGLSAWLQAQKDGLVDDGGPE